MTKILFDKAWTTEEKLEFVKPLLKRLYREHGFISPTRINKSDYLPWYTTLIKLFGHDKQNIESLYEFIEEEMPDFQKQRKKSYYTLDGIRIIFSKQDCKLLSDNYINMNSKLHYICSCGENSFTNLYNFLCSPKCNSCRLTEHTKKRRENRILIIKKYCNQHDCTFVDLKESDKGFPSSLIYYMWLWK